MGRDAFAQHRVSRGALQKLFLVLQIREGSEDVDHAPLESIWDFHHRYFAINSFQGLHPPTL
jgi:hypothetical protein